MRNAFIYQRNLTNQFLIYVYAKMEDQSFLQDTFVITVVCHSKEVNVR